MCRPTGRRRMPAQPPLDRPTKEIEIEAYLDELEARIIAPCISAAPKIPIGSTCEPRVSASHHSCPGYRRLVLEQRLPVLPQRLCLGSGRMNAQKPLCRSSALKASSAAHWKESTKFSPPMSGACSSLTPILPRASNLATMRGSGVGRALGVPATARYASLSGKLRHSTNSEASDTNRRSACR